MPRGSSAAGSSTPAGVARWSSLIGAAIALPIGDAHRPLPDGVRRPALASRRGCCGRAGRAAGRCPTIVIGLFVYGLIVIPQHKETGFAAAVALAIVMLPLMARSSQEVLLLVPGHPARGRRRPRGRALAHRAGGDRARRGRRDRHGRDPGHRPGGRRDRADAASSTASTPPTRSSSIRSGTASRPSRCCIYTSYDLPGPEALTRAWGAAFVLLIADPDGERRGAAAARAQPCEDGRRRMTALGSTGAVGRTAMSRCPRASGSPPRRCRRRFPSADATDYGIDAVRPAVFDIRDMSVFYGTKPALAGDDDEDLPQPGDRGDRAVGVRQVDVHPQPQPDERLDPRLQDRPARCSTTATTCTAAGVNRVEVRRRIGMVFQKPNPFPKSIFDNVAWAPRNLGMRAHLNERVERRAAAGGAVGRGQGPTQEERARACPAASSSGCASRARSRSSLTCCCSTSPPRRSTRSRPRRSRS